MSLRRVIEDFSRDCIRCSTPAELFALTAAVGLELSFNRVALVHGMWFRCRDRQLIRLDNFGDWADIFIDREYYLDDPALLACQRENTAFSWTKLSDLVPFGQRQLEILTEASRHGLYNGLTVPIGVMGEPTGCCSFSCDNPNLPSHWRCRAATLIAAEAFREARRLHGFPARACRLPRLSRRKLQCLRLIAIGKQDPLIADILGLRPSTVRTYVAMLRRDFDVVSRQQLAVEALRFGLISTTMQYPHPAE